MLDLAIHQFGPYLKTLVGTDYQIAANIMNGKEMLSPTDIAVALGTLYGIPPQTTTGVLKKLGATAAQVADGLSAAYKWTLAQTSQYLSAAGFTVNEVVNA